VINPLCWTEFWRECACAQVVLAHLFQWCGLPSWLWKIIQTKLINANRVAAGCSWMNHLLSVQQLTAGVKHWSVGSYKSPEAGTAEPLPECLIFVILYIYWLWGVPWWFCVRVGRSQGGRVEILLSLTGFVDLIWWASVRNFASPNFSYCSLLYKAAVNAVTLLRLSCFKAGKTNLSCCETVPAGQEA